MSDILISIPEAAKLAGASSQAVRKWIYNPRCPLVGYRRAGRLYVWRSDLAAWLEPRPVLPHPTAEQTSRVSGGPRNHA